MLPTDGPAVRVVAAGLVVPGLVASGLVIAGIEVPSIYGLISASYFTAESSKICLLGSSKLSC